MKREEHHDDIEAVGKQDGRSVEHQSTAKQLHQVIEREPLREITQVLQQVDDACQKIDGIGYGKIA